MAGHQSKLVYRYLQIDAQRWTTRPHAQRLRPVERARARSRSHCYRVYIPIDFVPRDLTSKIHTANKTQYNEGEEEKEEETGFF